MNDTYRPAAGDDPHASHDGLLVAALAADDLAGPARATTERIVATCTECRLLFDDIQAIAAATAILPAMARPRDFRLSQEDAARLRPMGWRRFVAAFGSTRFAMTRPLAVGLSTIGLAGLLLSAIPGQIGLFGSAASTPSLNGNQDTTALGQKGFNADASGRSIAGAPEVPASSSAASTVYGAVVTAGATVAATTPAGDASAAPASSVPQPSAGGGSRGPSGSTNPANLNDRSPSPVGIVVGGSDGTDTAGGPPPPDAYSTAKIAAQALEAAGAAGSGDPPSPLVIVSLLLLLAGIGLLAARSIAQRFSRI